jgi:hypothetical protein
MPWLNQVNIGGALVYTPRALIDISASFVSSFCPTSPSNQLACFSDPPPNLPVPTVKPEDTWFLKNALTESRRRLRQGARAAWQHGSRLPARKSLSAH